jgi:hypothetical protein
MVATESIPQESFLKEDSFGFIKAEDFEALGIDASDVPPGTFPALKHPSRLLSRFGGNAYGFGFFEAYDRLSPRDQRLLQSITHDKPEYAGRYYKEINRVYENMGLLIRFSSLGKPYYLIPVPYVSRSLSTIRNKADEISGVIQASTAFWPGYSERIEIHGQKGSVILEGGNITAWKVEGCNEADYVDEQKVSYGSTSSPAISHVNHKAQFEEILTTLQQSAVPNAVTTPTHRRRFD